MAIYDPSSGYVIWMERGPNTFSCAENERTRVSSRWNKLRSGKRAGHMNSNGYVVMCIEGKTIQGHRIAWALHYGEWPSDEIDHINGNKSDNRISNLRVVSPRENSQNRKRPKTNSSGSIGVHYHKRSMSWHARIMVDGKRHHLGSFNTSGEASEAYDRAAKKFNFHENHGRS